MGNLITVTVKIPQELNEKIERKMRKDGYATTSELIRDLLREYVKEYVEVKG